MRYQESGLRLLLCTSLPRYLLRVIGNLCEQRGGGLDALDRSGLFVSRGGGELRFSRTRAATLSIAPIKKLPSLSFGPVLYYVEHKVHRSFFPFFLFSLSSLSLSFLGNCCCQPRRRKFHRSLPIPKRLESAREEAMEGKGDKIRGKRRPW